MSGLPACRQCRGIHGSDPCSVLIPPPPWMRDAIAAARAEARAHWAPIEAARAAAAAEARARRDDPTRRRTR